MHPVVAQFQMMRYRRNGKRRILIYLAVVAVLVAITSFIVGT